MVKLAILWHMHQPFYEDLATGEHILPWVRLHAIKDYLGMVRLLDEFPEVRVTFNLVPSLLVQLQAFADDRAVDRHLAIGLKSAEALEPEEQSFLVAHGFHAPDRMVVPYPRYAELRNYRRAGTAFSIADLRDLQVWHKLAWMDPDALATDARLIGLVRKGRSFSEQDKQLLRDVELEILAQVIPAYQDASERRHIELSTSPFYHPILPLLCDTDAHLRAHPHSSLPRELFRRPDDAREQLARAMRFHTDLFGTAPRGVWPSEGSVSDAAVRLIAETGAGWIATDEGILARSLGGTVSAEALYRPYEMGDIARPIRCLFRDHALSDQIGFAYQSWDAAAAADDFVRRLGAVAKRFQAAGGKGDPIVTVILDGENAWEHYLGGGRPFLRAFYGRLERSPEIQTVTMAEAASAPARRLASVFPGSWINSDFYIWAGHRDDHRAWGQLAAARRAFDESSADVPEADRDRAFEELLIAEGSDWFWWYGDDHSSDHDRDFDELFRRHLRNVYRSLGLPVPDGLWMSNITTAAAAGPIRPMATIAPVLDGQVTGFAEWSGAATVPLGGGGGTMHRVTTKLVQSIRLGVGVDELFVRVDGPALVSGVAAGQFRLALLVGSGAASRLDLAPGIPDIRLAVGAIIEVAALFRAIGSAPGNPLSLSLLITDAAGHVVEQHPAGTPITLEIPSEELEAANWSV